MGLSGGFLLNRYRLPSEIPYAANKNLTKEIPMAEQWLTSLITDTPQEGYELAIALSRRGVRYTQPDPEVLHRLRPEYAEDASELTSASQHRKSTRLNS